MNDKMYPIIIDSLATAVIVFNQDYQIECINPAAEELFGVSQRRAYKEPISSLFGDENQDMTTQLQDNLHKGRAWTEHERILTVANNKEVTVDYTVSPLLVEGEGKILIEIVRLDRQLKIIKESHILKEHQATRSMLRGMAHEIKNPLGGLRGAAQLLEGELDNKELKEYTDIIIKEADRLHTLVDRMLGPNMVPNKVKHNIHEVLHHVYRVLSTKDNDAVNFRIDYDPSIPQLNFDRDMLVQAVMNIAGNALRAIEHKGELIFKTRVLLRYTINGRLYKLVACISIIDDGPGISDDIAAKIFFPMVSGQTNGTGLGLAISQMLINQHGGLIEFDTQVGRTEFRVMLPIE